MPLLDHVPGAVRRAFRLDRHSPHQVEEELDAELAFHLDMREAELRAKGLDDDAARAEARRRFGDLEDARRYCRALDDAGATARRRREWAHGWGQDLRFAMRQLRRAPASSGVAVLTLALGIGATTAIFSVVHSLMLAPLPYEDADRIVSVLQASANAQVFIGADAELVEAWRGAAPAALKRVGAYAEAPRMIRSDAGDPEALKGVRLSPEMADVLGMRPALGRFFQPSDATAAGPPVAMLAYGYWRRAFGGRADAIGQSIVLDGRRYTVIGVLPRRFVLPGFSPLTDQQVAVPLRTDTEVNLWGVGRLRPGVTPATASAQLSSVMQRLTADHPRYRNMIAVVRRQQDFLGASTRTTLLVLLGAVATVLLIACANVAGLLLARSAARQRELAVRAALGAGRHRLVRQLLTESGLLGLCGGAVGAAVAWLGLRVLIALRPPSLDELAGVRLEPWVLATSLGVAIATSLLFGLAPALLAAGEGLAGSLTGTSRSATGHRRSQQLRGALVMGEVALSVVLLVCAGLLVRSALAMQGTDVGFDPRGLTGVSVHLPPERYATTESRLAAYLRVQAAVRRIPGLSGAVVGNGDVPPETGVMLGRLEIDGRTLNDDERASTIGFDRVQPEYFRLVGIPLRAGRIPDGTGEDGVVINDGFARRYWPEGRAVGGRFRLSAEAPWKTVVGVAGDVRSPGRTSSVTGLHVYEPFSGAWERGTLLLRTRGDAPHLLRDLTRAVASVDPDIEVGEVQSSEQLLAARLAGPRFSMTLLGAFALIALVLATVGLYGVISLAVTQRTREIGVRLALGATPQRVTGMVVRNAMMLAGAGLVVGIGGSFGAVRAVRSMLYGVEPLDAPSFVAAIAVLGTVAFLAALIPARRASRVDAMVALRAE